MILFQEKFLAIAYNIIPTIEEETDVFSSVALCQHIVTLFKRYPNHENIIYASLQVTLLISAHRFGARNICKAKMLRVLADLTEKYPSNDKTVALRLVLWIFWGIVAYKENLRDVMKDQIGHWVYAVADTAQVSTLNYLFQFSCRPIFPDTFFFLLQFFGISNLVTKAVPFESSKRL